MIMMQKYFLLNNYKPISYRKQQRNPMVTLLFSFLSISDRDIYSIFYQNRQEFLPTPRCSTL